ncbi:hypothetical protein [Daejeonella sp.]|uniref:hypothetical protein n=1 Tax=Daejeonella sp. TaxID=2805397 RepID=UPI0025C60DD9|nr:hypothetical protein [Daejeonella sp.]
MDIKFGDKKLRKLALDVRKCVQEMGKRRADLFLRRLTDLRDAETLEDVRYLPGHYHELKNTRKGSVVMRPRPTLSPYFYTTRKSYTLQ